MIEEGQNLAAFRQQNVQAHLETALTPVGALGYPNPNKQTDNYAWLTTNHVWLQLQADGIVATSAFGIIQYPSSAVDRSDPTRRLDFAVYDGDGTVIGTHAEAQLYGGRELDMDEIQERVLTRANTETDRSLQIVPVDLSDFRAGVAYQIDPKPADPCDRRISRRKRVWIPRSPPAPLRLAATRRQTNDRPETGVTPTCATKHPTGRRMIARDKP